MNLAAESITTRDEELKNTYLKNSQEQSYYSMVEKR